MLGDLRTGRNLVYLPASGVAELSWSESRNAADDLSVTFNLADRATKKLGIPGASTPGATFAVAVVDGVPKCGGPIWISNYARATRKRKITAKGMWSYFDHRVLIPLIAQTRPVISPTTGEPDPAMSTFYSGISFGTMAKRMVQRAVQFTGGNVPIVFGPDEAAGREKEYEGTDLAYVGERLRQLTELENGPDITFTPRFTQDGLGMEWVLRTGTEAKPNLSGETIHIWDYSVPKPSIADLETTIDASNLASRYWMSGGRNDDRTYIERADDSTLLAAGFPLLEVAASSDATTVEGLVSKAVEQVRVNRLPKSSWSFKVRTDGDPNPADVSVGDYCRIIVAGDDEIPDSGPDGYLRRVAAKSGDLTPWVKITTLDTYSEV
ncbi:hypothetical protein C5E11_03810 [Clavibacter michiganensis]|nr:hypothetical protein C5E11_03810 [Clavibacter michiganensis]